MAYGGIDPGKSGFASLINDDGELIESEPQPLFSKEKGDQFDIVTMNAILAGWKERGVKLVVIELQNPQGGVRSSAQRAFYQSAPYFIWKALLVANGIPYQVIKDTIWKKAAGVQAPKRDAKKKEPARPKGQALADWKKTHDAWKKADAQRIAGNKKKVKAESVKTAQALFPNADLRRTPKCRVPDDNKAESMLLAEVARRLHQGAQRGASR